MNLLPSNVWSNSRYDSSCNISVLAFFGYPSVLLSYSLSLFSILRIIFFCPRDARHWCSAPGRVNGRRTALIGRILEVRLVLGMLHPVEVCLSFTGRLYFWCKYELESAVIHLKHIRVCVCVILRQSVHSWS